MRRIIAVIFVAAITLAVAWYIAGLGGQVGVTIAGYTFEATAPVAVLFFLLAVLAVYIVVRVVGAIFFGIPAALGRSRERGRRSKGDAAITRTLVAIAAGDRGDARREAVRAQRLLGETPQTLLLAAEANRLAGDETAASEIYRKLSERDDAAFLGLRGLFRQAMARQDWTEAAAIAARAERVHPGAAWLREERAQLAIRTGNWSQALLLSPPDVPSVALKTAVAEQTSDPREAMRLARQAFEQDPSFTPGVLAYARRLRAEGRESRAQEAIRTGWKAHPQPDLAEFFLAPVTGAANRLTAAAKLAAVNPAHLETMLLLSRLALDAGRLAYARRNAEAALAAGCNERRLWVLIADIEATERGDTEEGRAAQRDALRRAATADADPAWRCEVCGTVHDAWHPACPVCHAAGRITWGKPRVSAAAPLVPTARIATNAEIVPASVASAS
ncbi:MAG TPA: heme biosynthesis HemY N-terminal domain-containing protein [Acetobacteraceae bacterium]|jgi:HemY protein|nr:heme biosynthesis HemY N-terminal domain-containing protein [Acetobacteraceae bacterium]